MQAHTRIERVALVALLLTLALFRFEGLALAISDENKVLFGPVGIAAGEAARVSISVIGDPDSIGDPNTRPWTFMVRLFSRRGAIGLERRVDVLPGTFATLGLGPLDPAAFPPDTLGRRTLRAEIVGFNPQPDPPGRYTATLEVFGLATGRTHVLLGGPDTVPVAR